MSDQNEQVYMPDIKPEDFFDTLEKTINQTESKNGDIAEARVLWLINNFSAICGNKAENIISNYDTEYRRNNYEESNILVSAICSNIKNEEIYKSICLLFKEYDWKISRYIGLDSEIPLHVAVFNCNIIAVKVLLDPTITNDCSPIYDFPNWMGDTSLHMIMERLTILDATKVFPILTLLLNAGAHIDIKNCKGETPLDILSSVKDLLTKKDAEGRDILHYIRTSTIDDEQKNTLIQSISKTQENKKRKFEEGEDSDEENNHKKAKPTPISEVTGQILFKPPAASNAQDNNVVRDKVDNMDDKTKSNNFIL